MKELFESIPDTFENLGKNTFRILYFVPLFAFLSAFYYDPNVISLIFLCVVSVSNIYLIIYSQYASRYLFLNKKKAIAKVGKVLGKLNLDDSLVKKTPLPKYGLISVAGAIAILAYFSSYFIFYALIAVNKFFMIALYLNFAFAFGMVIELIMVRQFFKNMKKKKAN